MTIPKRAVRNSRIAIFLPLLLVAAGCGALKRDTGSIDDGSNAPADLSSYAFEIGQLPDDLAPVGAVFTKHVDVFGVNVIATPATKDYKVLHAANVLAQYLDNDADGTPDNQEVIESMVANQAVLIMSTTEQEAEGIEQELSNLDASALAALGDGGQDLFGSETNPSNGFDGALEEIHHLIYRQGWLPVFSVQLSDQKGSDLANAMDLARGGQFESIPDSYPEGAWYTYSDQTCDYSGCQIDEYFYWAHTSLLGAQQERGDQISNEWRLETPDKVRSGDPGITAILEDPALGLPTILPDGHYTPGIVNRTRTSTLGVDNGATTTTDDERTSAAGAEAAFDDCLTDTPDGTVPENLYTVGDVVETTEYPGFSKTLTVYGLTVVAQDSVDDTFLTAVADVVVEMFPTDVADPETQSEILASFYRYKALIPVPAGEDIDPGAVENWDGTVCDAIFYGVEGQVMEVVEHILHYVSDIGLHTAYPEHWGLNADSQLQASMNEAEAAGIYQTSSYNDIPSPILERVLLQEYAYWIITSYWNLQKNYGIGEGEWTATTPTALEELVPTAHDLVIATIPNVMASPTATATLDSIETYQP